MDMDAVAFLQEHIKGLFLEVLGLRFLEATPERVKASMAVRPDLCTTNRIVHGGALMAFADTLGAYVTALYRPEQRRRNNDIRIENQLSRRSARGFHRLRRMHGAPSRQAHHGVAHTYYPRG